MYIVHTYIHVHTYKLKIAWPMGLPDRGVCLDSARALSSSFLPARSRVRRLVAVSPNPRARFSCCLQVEKSCERLAVLTSLEQASMLAHRTGADQDPWRCACAGAATKSWPIDRSSLGQVASSPSTAANKKLLRKWWQKQGPRENSTTAAQVSSKCWPTAMDAPRPSATMTDA